MTKKKPSPTIAVDFPIYSHMFTALTRHYHDGAPVTCDKARRFAKEILDVLVIALTAQGRREWRAHKKKMLAGLTKRSAKK